MQEALDNILEKKKLTTVIIAHRLSTIRNCDIINVLVYGDLMESGTHDELMEKGGYYKKLVEKQDGTNSESNSALSSRSNSAADLKGLADDETQGTSNHMEGIPHISFRNVKFAYPTRPKKIIFDGFNLDIEQGSTVALVGPSGTYVSFLLPHAAHGHRVCCILSHMPLLLTLQGGGKSTTVGLLERFYDPIEGAIEYQGYYLRGLNVHWYRDQIGYVGQEPTLCECRSWEDIYVFLEQLQSLTRFSVLSFFVQSTIQLQITLHTDALVRHGKKSKKLRGKPTLWILS